MTRREKQNILDGLYLCIFMPLENRATFQKRLGIFSKKNQLLIDLAYDLSKEAHRPQTRDEGTRYFDHPRAVALILLDELKIKDPNIIIAALLHDTVEDSPIFGNRKLALDEWQQTTVFRLTRIFNKEVARIVVALTKVGGHGFKTKHDAEEYYIVNLKKTGPKAVMVKMADRLHNLRTIGDCTKEKQKRKIQETREVYFPLFLTNQKKYPRETSYFLAQIEKQMNILETK